MTPDKLGRPLSRKIVGLVVLNLVLLAVVVAVFAQWQFGWSLESLVLGPGRDRILVLANAFARELDSVPYNARSELLVTYSRSYDADFFLFSPRGESLAGRQETPPKAVLDRMEFSRPLRRGPPARGGDAGMRPAPALRPGPPPGAPFFVMTRDPLRYWVGAQIFTTGEDGERGVPGVLLMRSGSLLNTHLFFDWRILMWLGAIMAGVSLLCWWPFVHGVTHAIQQMERATEVIAQGEFEAQAMQRRNDELGRLGWHINRMAGRLGGFVQRQKRFLGDTAHELSAPIARIQFALGILEQRVDEAQQTHVTVLREEIQEMSHLVNELLLFSKAGVKTAPAPMKNVDLNAVVQRAIAQQLPGSGDVRAALEPGLLVAAHEPYLLRAISNVVRNALRYAGEDGPITIAARREGEKVVLTIIDCGPGLPEESLEDVFEPFYRPEAARSRDTGGTGLGLAIVKSCVEACHGSVRCRNCVPSGLEVTISLVSAGTAG